ncbi:hypothetical protein N474_23305 [Pseudoalteromonas luteoviolacea CPMOR-2]|uniref:DUF4879 domain-containing protein n=1 Tax=Pseudoalteromonas luteoviolacea TaxID=43657 RepID=UPI0007B08AB7|nr:DUF4879 domain-containing protein [Pseudoalteromonas luteoviolacea]KZN52145.1 hypothetical protein N474_23305 [Pseudoalteromonas luteoviolacea CPMOR-2]
MKKLLMGLTVFSTFSVAASELPELDALLQDPAHQKYEEALKAEVISTHENYQLYLETLRNNGEVVPLAPAPPISYLEIRGVLSAQYQQWDYVDPSSFSTNQNHGGEFYAVTVEYGYATPASRRFVVNGSPLKLYTSKNITDAGNVVIGFINYWHNTQTSFTGGTSTYQGTSINFPYNKEDDRLYIR